MLYELSYCGIRAHVLRDWDTGIFFGELEHEGCSYSFQGDSLASAEAAFHDVVDEFYAGGDPLNRFRYSELDKSQKASTPLPADPDDEKFNFGRRFDY